MSYPLSLVVYILSLFLFITACRSYSPDTSPESGFMQRLNSPYLERNPYLSSSGKFLFFMSTRGGQTWSQPHYSYYQKTPQYEGDIWLSQRSKSGEWQAPQCLGEGLNTMVAEDEPNISLDEERLFFQRWQNDWLRSGGPYYQVNLGDGQWIFEGLGSGITDFFEDQWAKGQAMATDGASLSPDGKVLVFALGYYDARMDLYISWQQINGKWTYPQKLKASTHRNDRAPFIAADSRTLYFASNGYGKQKIGGMDILRTTLLGGNRCGRVDNLGKLVNTKANEQGFCLSLSGDSAILVREQDLYALDLRQLPDSLKPQPMLVLEGYTSCGENFEACEVEVFWQNKRLARLQSQTSNGHYYIVVPKSSEIQEINLKISKKPHFKTYEQLIKLDSLKRFVKIRQDCRLAPVDF